MGQYLNPDASGFAACLKSGDYVDKTGLIAYMNGMLGGKHRLICSTRPRRFGKTNAIEMLAAYYSKGYDCRELFKTLKISADPSFEVHRNRYDVLALDILWFLSNAGKDRNIVDYLQEQVGEELKRSFPDIEHDAGVPLAEIMRDITFATGTKFVVLIDEWDVLFRERPNAIAQHDRYLAFLRELFSKDAKDTCVALAYMTGILPIMKDGNRPALPGFDEFTMLDAGPLWEYVGFTQDEVRDLCRTHHADYRALAKRYDGYRLNTTDQVFCPYAIAEALYHEEISDYWAMTEAYTALKDYISLKIAGLKDAVTALIGGRQYSIDAQSFTGSLTSFTSTDDVLTALVHLGYLGYDAACQAVFIPTEEIRDNFIDCLEGTDKSQPM